MADKETPFTIEHAEREEVHPLVGVPHGFVDHNGEKIVYEFDEDGNYAGWHKEPGSDE